MSILTIDHEKIAPSFHYDDWTGAYRDKFNDIWVSRPFERKQWIVAFRDRGNVSSVVSRHHNLGKALLAAENFARTRRCINHPHRDTRDILDGEPLCQACCDRWARGEAV